jgi:1-acyl-sn-glycerol-3-phosphate acyltransferase
MRKNHLWYQMFRYPIVGTGLRLFYKKIKVVGKHNLPKDKPILFVPNHQNSFMDALHVVTTVKPFIYFLTRAEAFRPAPQAWFLRSLNMLPVYRVRDGFSSVQKNNDIFEECFKYFGRNDAVLIFPEANHDLKRRIRPLSKGFTRIAFGGEEYYNWELDLQVVPVGLNYTHHREARNVVQVHYGEPIPVKDYQELYKEDQNEATRGLKHDVSEGMKKLVFHVQNLEDYAVHKILWQELEPNSEHLTDPDIANERIQKTNAHITEELKTNAKKLDKLITSTNINGREFLYADTFKAKEFLLLPLYLFSLINNVIPYQPVRYLTTKVIKDHAFDASIKFLSGIVVLPVFYGLVSLILWVSGVNPSLIWGYLGLSFITSPFFIRAKSLLSINPVKKLKKEKPQIYQKIMDGLIDFKLLRERILDE